MRYQQNVYQYKRCTDEDEKMIAQLTAEGVVISSIARITGASKANVINKIRVIAGKIVKPVLKEEDQEYEVDELYTFIGNKETSFYIIYALNKTTKKVVIL